MFVLFAGLSAGGCRNDLRCFATNPQFLLTVQEPDDHEDRKEDSNQNLQVRQHSICTFQDFLPDKTQICKTQFAIYLAIFRAIFSSRQDPKCEVIISLAQEHRRSKRDKKVKLMQIGFCIYLAADNTGRLVNGCRILLRILQHNSAP